MAIHTYLGVGGLSHDVSDIYIGINNVARKVTKAYIGVDNVARLFYMNVGTLEETSWADISEISKSGLASNYWSIGDTKSISFNGTTYYVQIVGFNHDSVVDSKTYGVDKAGITFQFGVGNSTSKNGVYSQYYKLDTIDENSNAWQTSDMRYNTMEILKSYLPTDLQNVIATVKKYTSAGSGATYGTYATQDDLFLLSEIEITGKSSYSVAAEGNQYAYYSAGNSAKRYLNGKSVDYWLRSPMAGDTHFTCYVEGDNGKIDTTSPTDQLYVSFAFCV